MIGGNGAGKSNFIQFFHLLRRMQENRLNEHIATKGMADSFLYHGRKRSSFIKGKLIFSQQDSDAANLYAFTLVPNDDDKLVIKKEEAGYKAIGANDFDVFHHDNLYNYSSVVLKPRSTFPRNKYIREYLKNFRVYHFHDTSRDALLRTPCRLDDNRMFALDGNNLAAFLYWMQQGHPKSFRLLERTVQLVAPFFESFQLQPDRLSPDQIKLIWREKNSDQLYNAQHLSDGTIRFIALATLLLQPTPPPTIIIDEPELGLHPKAINKLAGLIKRVSSQSQVIISTQSVPLVDCFAPNDIITVDRHNEQSEFVRLDHTQLQAWLEDYSLGELWVKRVIKGQP